MALVLLLNKGLAEEAVEDNFGWTDDEVTVGLVAPALEPLTSCCALIEFES